MSNVNEIKSIRQNNVGSFAKKERFRELFFFGMLVLASLIILTLLIKLYHYSQIEDLKANELYRTEADFVNGGKRFIDGAYSLNAATIKYDQFRAIRMYVNDELKNEHLTYIHETDLIRKVEESGMTSSIQWGSSKFKVLKSGIKGAKIHYTAYININDIKLAPIDLIIEVVAVKKSDENTDGIGVKNKTDIADKPFEVTIK